MKHLLVVGSAVAVSTLLLYWGRCLRSHKTTPQQWAWLVASALALCSAALLLGYGGGRVYVDALDARLHVLWPDFDALPSTDKGLIVGAAVKCKLVDETPEPSAVVGCIRRGATVLDEQDPTISAPKRIDQLLHRSRLGASP